jgi:hypothetical protein
MRSLPFVTTLSILFLGIWISVCSFYVKEINDITTVDDQKFEIAKINKFDCSSPASQGINGNKVRKVASHSQFSIDKNKTNTVFDFPTLSEIDFSFLSYNFSAYTEVTIAGNFLKFYSWNSLNLFYCIWRN